MIQHICLRVIRGDLHRAESATDCLGRGEGGGRLVEGGNGPVHIVVRRQLGGSTQAAGHRAQFNPRLRQGENDLPLRMQRKPGWTRERGW